MDWIDLAAAFVVGWLVGAFVTIRAISNEVERKVEFRDQEHRALLRELAKFRAKEEYLKMIGVEK